MTTNHPNPRLIVVCGLPGSGKTTYAKSLEIALHAVRFEPDEWLDALSWNLWDERARAKVEAFQWKLARRLLELGHTVIIEWGTWSKSERDELRLAARKLGAAVELHYLSAPLDVLLQRIQDRGIENPPIRIEHLKSWAQKFEAPAVEELALFNEPLFQPPPNC
jgi:predicted kinase